MAGASRCWQVGVLRALALRGTALLLPDAVQPRPRSRRPRLEPPAAAQARGQEGRPGQAPHRRAAGHARAGSAEVNERAVSATAGRDHRRRAAHALLAASCPAACPISIFTLADPYRLIIDMPDVTFRLPKGCRPAGPRADPGVSLRPVRARQVAHRHRYHRPRARRAAPPWRAGPAQGGRMPQYRPAADRPGRASCAKLPPPAPRPKERADGVAEAVHPQGRNAKPVIVIDAGHGGVDPGAASAAT